MTRELPIIFGSEMILRLPPRGPKSQTRRTRGLGEINESPDDWTVEQTTPEAATLLNRLTGELRTIRCPYGPAGTRLWVKEGWRPDVSKWGYPEEDVSDDVIITYLADKDSKYVCGSKIPENWAPPKHARRGSVTPLFMPRWASRFIFINTGWRLERVQSITDADAVAEGMVRPETMTPEEADCYPGAEKVYFDALNQPRECYRRLWDHLNGKKLPWSRNGWVWVVGFEPKGAAR